MKNANPTPSVTDEEFLESFYPKARPVGLHIFKTVSTVQNDNDDKEKSENENEQGTRQAE